jgi:nucleoside-diphosphate-sugar epimerase
MHRAVVSGITGHLGKEVARQLVAAGVEVHGLTRLEMADRRLRNGGAELHSIDGHTESLIALLEMLRPDTVFHLAALYRREHQPIDVTPLVDTNVLFSTQLLEAARLAGCSRLITAASFFQNFAASESAALNLYAATKQAFEKILDYYADAFNLSAATLTLYEVYSELDERAKLMTVVADAWRNASELKLSQEQVWVDFVHVEDVAAAFLQAALLLEDKVVEPGRVVNYSVCSGRDVTPMELVSLFERIGGRKIFTKRGEFPSPSRHMPRPWRGDVLPGWVPKVTLEDGVARIVNRLQ